MDKRVKLTGVGLTLFAPDVFGMNPDTACVKLCIQDTICRKIAAGGSAKLRSTLGTLVSNPAALFTVKRVDDLETEWGESKRAAARKPLYSYFSWSEEQRLKNDSQRRAAIDAAEMKEYKRQLIEGL